MAKRKNSSKNNTEDRLKKQEAYDSTMRQKASFKQQKEDNNLKMIIVTVGILVSLIIASIIFNKSF